LDCSFGELDSSAASVVNPESGHPMVPIQPAPIAKAATRAPRHEPRFFMIFSPDAPAAVVEQR
jgi:hypothetical protein